MTSGEPGETTLAVIGLGNMGGAVVRGLSGREGYGVIGYDLDIDKVDDYAALGMAKADTLLEAGERAPYILLAVKPQYIEQTIRELRPVLTDKHCLLSIAAGVTMGALSEACGGVCPVVRVMPNTPAMVGAGVFALCFDDPLIDDARKSVALELFTSLGQAHVLPESSFDAFTAVVGSGPAYVYYFMDALVEAGVSLGLARGQCAEMVKALFDGSTKLSVESGRHLCELREMVTSPAGTTIAACNALDEKAVRSAIIEAVKAASRRSVELGCK